jgi:orotate phosphoribosyltransferase
VQEVQQSYGMPVVTIANLDDLLGYLEGAPQYEENLRAIAAYRQQYGVSPHG